MVDNVYDGNSKLKIVPTQKDVQANLMAKEQNIRNGIGITVWISSGMKIQETQLALSRFVRMRGRNPTPEDKLELAKRRQRFIKRLDAFHRQGAELFPDTDFLDPFVLNPPLEDDFEHDDDIELLAANPLSTDDKLPENMDIVLPSSFGILPEGMEIAHKQEIDLRIAQANDTLAAIRLEIGHKSFIYWKQINIVEGKKGKTRAYTQVNAVDRNVAHHLRVYSNARWALGRLKASPDILNKFQPIEKKDTHTLPNISKSNAPGNWNKNIPWFWGLNIHGDSTEDFHMEERKHSNPLDVLGIIPLYLVYRVNYLRAKARYDRWLEESKLIPWEMRRTMLFFSGRAAEWDGLSKDTTPGKECYARRQSAMWRGFQTQALTDFQQSGAI